MLANSVSPPCGGHCLIYRMLPIGGSASHETSLCQPSPLARGLSLSAWMIISSGWPGACGAAGWMCRFAEMAAERQMLLRRHVLIAEEDHAVLRQGAVDFVHLPVGSGCGEIDAADFRADDRRQLVDRDGFVGRGLVGDMTIPWTVVAAQGAHVKPFPQDVSRDHPLSPRDRNRLTGSGCRQPPANVCWMMRFASTESAMCRHFLGFPRREPDGFLGGADQRAGCPATFLHIPPRLLVPCNDPGTGLDVHHPVLDQRGAQADARIHRPVGCEVADAAGVDVAAARVPVPR